MSTARVDTFAQLRVAYTPEINGKIILPTTLADFRNNGLITPASSSGSIGSLTEKGHVAISMVNVSGEGGDVDTWLDEPFMELEVLPILQDTRHPLALAVDEFRSEYERTNY
ncbi:TPA: hypothetical protein DIV49_02275 [Candidatus Saccharibacteria bacterium]|nr:hypothetical protein [Candidatus Saccharibacteria bacterium]HRJ91078.1 hypothetical protein [Candidatus Saccharibacteria bacterium]